MGRRWLLLGVAVLGFVALVWLGLWVAAGPGIARGTTVLGVGIGGQTRSGAVVTLERELAAVARTAIPVRAAEAEASVDPTQAGLGLDAEATAAAAGARSWNPLALVTALGGGKEVEPIVALDRPALRSAVDRLAGTVDVAPVEGTLRYGRGGVPKLVAPVPGRGLDRADAVDALAAEFLVGDYVGTDPGRPLELPVEVAEPDVSSAELARVAEEVATPATSADVLLDVEGTQVLIPPRLLAATLSFVPDGAGSLRAELDGAALLEALAEPLAVVEDPALDATFRIRSGRPRVVPSKPGREVLAATLSAAVLPVLTETGPARAASVPLEVSEPEVTTEVARGLGVTEQVSSFTTYYPSDFAPRLTNIHRAADLMDSTLVLPGKVFSLNRIVGERTAARGFAAGFIISGGKLEVDFGGGVSQLVTTTFNAAYFAGLEIVEHHPHSFYISRYPEGREATVAWGVKDLRFRNDSPHGIFVATSYTNSSVTVSTYGTKRYRIESVKGARYDSTPFPVVDDARPAGTDQGDCVPTSGVSGFRVVVNRLFYQGGEQVRSEEFRTTYAPEAEVRCGRTDPPPKPKPKPTPTPTPTPTPGT